MCHFLSLCLVDPNYQTDKKFHFGAEMEMEMFKLQKSWIGELKRNVFKIITLNFWLWLQTVDLSLSLKLFVVCRKWTRFEALCSFIYCELWFYLRELWRKGRMNVIRSYMTRLYLDDIASMLVFQLFLWVTHSNHAYVKFVSFSCKILYT